MRRNRFVSARRQRPGEPSIEMHQRGSYLVRHLVRGFAISLDQPFLPRNRRHAMRGQLVDLVPFARSARWGQAPLFWIAKGIVDPLYPPVQPRSEEHTSELQPLMRSSYAVFCLKKKQKYSGSLLQIILPHIN